MSHKSEAENKLRIADHLLNMTYSIVKEPKLLVSVIDNIYQAMELLVTDVLDHESKIASIGPYKTIQEKLDVFRRKIISKYGLKREFIEYIAELLTILEEHKKSIVEFKKKEKYIISDNDYNLRTLTGENVHKQLKQAKIYIKEMYKIIGDG